MIYTVEARVITTETIFKDFKNKDDINALHNVPLCPASATRAVGV